MSTRAHKLIALCAGCIVFHLVSLQANAGAVDHQRCWHTHSHVRHPSRGFDPDSYRKYHSLHTRACAPTSRYMTTPCLFPEPNISDHPPIA